MKRYQTGSEAPYGLFVSVRPLDVRFVGADGESLEGHAGAQYVHLPMWTVVALGPVLGGFFLISFPLLALAALLVVLGRATAGHLATRYAWVARSAYRPVMATFRGDDDGAPSGDAAEDCGGLEDLWEEVRERAECEKRAC